MDGACAGVSIVGQRCVQAAGARPEVTIVCERRCCFTVATAKVQSKGEPRVADDPRSYLLSSIKLTLQWRDGEFVVVYLCRELPGLLPSREKEGILMDECEKEYRMKSSWALWMDYDKFREGR